MNNFNLNAVKNMTKEMKNSANMEQFLLSHIGTPQTQEMFQLVTMIKNHDGSGIEKMAKDVCKKQGIDMDGLMELLKSC